MYFRGLTTPCVNAASIRYTTLINCFILGANFTTDTTVTTRNAVVVNVCWWYNNRYYTTPLPLYKHTAGLPWVFFIFILLKTHRWWVCGQFNFITYMETNESQGCQVIPIGIHTNKTHTQTHTNKIAYSHTHTLVSCELNNENEAVNPNLFSTSCNTYTRGA